MRPALWAFVAIAALFAEQGYADVRQDQQIAFVASKDGNWELFVCDSDGSQLKQLSFTAYDEKQPSWSTDRLQITYAASDGNLNLVEVASGIQQRVDVGPEPGARLNPALSPDGSLIAFSHFKAGAAEDADLQVVELESGKRKTLIGQYGMQLSPTWSPDGRQIAYANTHCARDCDRIIQELWLSRSNGGHARQLLMLNAHAQDPAWSPDGTRIAFAADTLGQFEIWVLTLATRKLERITSNEHLDISPAWSPDGSELAFVSTRTGRTRIWIRELESGEARLLTIPGWEDDVQFRDVAW